MLAEVRKLLVNVFITWSIASSILWSSQGCGAIGESSSIQPAARRETDVVALLPDNEGRFFVVMRGFPPDMSEAREETISVALHNKNGLISRSFNSGRPFRILPRRLRSSEVVTDVAAAYHKNRGLIVAMATQDGALEQRRQGAVSAVILTAIDENGEANPVFRDESGEVTSVLRISIPTAEQALMPNFSLQSLLADDWGRITVGGIASAHTQDGGKQKQLCLFRTWGGILDTDYGRNGFVQVPVGGDVASLRLDSLTPRRDQSLLAAGEYRSLIDGRTHLFSVKLDNSGFRDLWYYSRGFAELPIDFPPHRFRFDVTALPQGNRLVYLGGHGSGDRQSSDYGMFDSSLDTGKIHKVRSLPSHSTNSTDFSQDRVHLTRVIADNSLLVWWEGGDGWIRHERYDGADWSMKENGTFYADHGIFFNNSKSTNLMTSLFQCGWEILSRALFSRRYGIRTH